jgi:2-polyprenyl-6-methoxyphenol hydroxylase-like FAD-dependent oxidoreductase
MQRLDTDVLVVGSGLTGATAGLEFGRRASGLRFYTRLKTAAVRYAG